MDKNYKNFIQAIKEKKIIKLEFCSEKRGYSTRVCIPFDFGPSKKSKNGIDRYHFYDLDSPDGSHNLSILPNKIISITITDKNFDPKDYIKWTPDRSIKRNRGIYS